MASSSAALKMATVCMLALFAGQLLVAAPASSAALPAPVCVPDNCPICVEGACRFCIPGQSRCVTCVRLCFCDCNLETSQCNGICFNKCMQGTPLP